MEDPQQPVFIGRYPQGFIRKPQGKFQPCLLKFPIGGQDMLLKQMGDIQSFLRQGKLPVFQTAVLIQLGNQLVQICRASLYHVQVFFLFRA